MYSRKILTMAILVILAMLISFCSKQQDSSDDIGKTTENIANSEIKVVTGDNDELNSAIDGNNEAEPRTDNSNKLNSNADEGFINVSVFGEKTLFKIWM